MKQSSDPGDVLSESWAGSRRDLGGVVGVTVPREAAASSGGPLQLPAWGRHHESEKARCLRTEAENKSIALSRDPWRSNQAAPPHLQVRSSRTRTAFRTRNFAFTENLYNTIGEFVVSDIRLPYRPAQTCTEFRPRKKPGFGVPPLKRLDHEVPVDGAWSARTMPNSAVEPWVDMSRCFLYGKDPPRPQRGGPV
mmetsp:Transcript_110271/g.235505  ORF Transcript_110271/g.235505 Transcript_110271/m.235505 type:complete len:194 (+) Transcript_110271:101-682(+)